MNQRKWRLKIASQSAPHICDSFSRFIRDGDVEMESPAASAPRQSLQIHIATLRDHRLNLTTSCMPIFMRSLCSARQAAALDCEVLPLVAFEKGDARNMSVCADSHASRLNLDIHALLSIFRRNLCDDDGQNRHRGISCQRLYMCFEHRVYSTRSHPTCLPDVNK